MSEHTHHAASSNGFEVDKKFEAYKKEDGNFIIINDCRITRTTIDEDTSHGQKIKSQFALNANADVMALYIKGDEMKKAHPSVHTARGRCIFFIYDESDHGPIAKTTELRIKKSAIFYFKIENDVNFSKTTFENFVNVQSQKEKMVFSSSPRTGHSAENIILFP